MWSKAWHRKGAAAQQDDAHRPGTKQSSEISLRQRHFPTAQPLGTAGSTLDLTRLCPVW